MMQNHWTARQLEHEARVANACGYGYYQVGPREPSVHYYMTYASIEIRKAAGCAVGEIDIAMIATTFQNGPTVTVRLTTRRGDPGNACESVDLL